MTIKGTTPIQATATPILKGLPLLIILVTCIKPISANKQINSFLVSVPGIVLLTSFQRSFRTDLSILEDINIEKRVFVSIMSLFLSLEHVYNN